jgi:hypothetical protein
MTLTTTRAASHLIAIGLAAAAAAACGVVLNDRPRAATRNARAPLSELWVEPEDIASRNLLIGSGRPETAPSHNIEYRVLKFDPRGYSKGYDVEAPDGRKWDIKVGKESQTEIVLSRVLWALGYHQPATYFMDGWRLKDNWDLEGRAARFRLQSDHTVEGEWNWLDNPFESSRAFGGLIAINLLFNNWDLKNNNNRVYSLPGPDGTRIRRYVVQDLGASLGTFQTFPYLIGTRNEVGDFESSPFVRKVDGSKVELTYRGRHQDVIRQLRVADVIWACELMNELSDEQLDDAFKAAKYDDGTRARFVKKIRAKIREGLELRKFAAVLED